MATIQEDSDLGRNGNGAVHTAESIKRSFLDSLFYRQAQFPKLATSHDYYKALAYTVRDIMAQKWLSSARTYTLAGSRTVCYLSAEFLLNGAKYVCIGFSKTAGEETGRGLSGAFHQRHRSILVFVCEEPGPGIASGRDTHCPSADMARGINTAPPANQGAYRRGQLGKRRTKARNKIFANEKNNRFSKVSGPWLHSKRR